MATVGDLVDRAGLLTLTPSPAGKVHREEISAVHEVSSPASAIHEGSLVYVSTSAWTALPNPQNLPLALRSRGAVAVIVDTDDEHLSAEFVGACVQQSLPVFMLPRSSTITDVTALVEPAVKPESPGTGDAMMPSIADAIESFAHATGTTVWLVLDGCIVTNSTMVDFDLLEKVLALATTPLDAISSKSSALRLRLPRSGHIVAMVNPNRRALAPERVRNLIGVLDDTISAIRVHRATRGDLETALIRELTRTQVPSAALDPWVASFGLLPGDRVRAVAATVTGESAGIPDLIVGALRDLGLLSGSACVASFHDGIAYALVRTGDAELENPLANNVFDDRIVAMTEVFGRIHGHSIEVGVSSYVLRTSDDLMRGLINARQLAERQARAALTEVPQIALPVPLAATLLNSSSKLSTALERSLLHPVIEYDAEKGTSLLESLRTFMALDCHWGATANELGIHINTLRYRLSRVERLTGRGFQSTADRSDYYLALCVRESQRDERPTP
ncbi:helix-turn-helix domain-containing protein [Gordonia sp. LSe1-13]|uniref:Helix-turn-helix domain-containing protein n=1 Tax=Gordonia sesuvii TaxID=3116777 RepID=A0ABU7MFG8_9ACTN|nr:helix-turn-helix domain-containing protein [Gordonia sp. LSe1-13]